jgi:type II secretory pathway pseudopilin PulG
MRASARQGGFTFVELLVAGTIMILLLSALGSLFVNTSRAYRVNDEVSERQQSADAAAQLLSYEIGLAGYRGSDQAAITRTFAGSTFSITKGASATASDTIVVRYYEDRFSNIGEQLLITFDAIPVGGSYNLYRKEQKQSANFSEVAKSPAIQNVKNLKVIGYTLNNGKEYPRDPTVTHAWIEPYTLTSDITPYTLVALKLELTFTDDLKKQVVIGIDNPQQIPPSQTPFLPTL